MGAHVSVPAYKRSIPQRYALWGLKCQECGGILFPPKAYCPYCGARGEFVPFKLRPEGEVYSFTEISAAGAPPEFSDLARTRASFTVALVRLDDGPMITAQLTSMSGEIHIGTRVRGVFKRIYVEEGVIRYGLKFERA